jgi:hypothetical protein
MGQRHAPAALYPRERTGTHCTGAGWDPRGRSGQVRKISPPTGIRSPDRPARSQSLHRLRYPAHQYNSTQAQIKDYIRRLRRNSVFRHPPLKTRMEGRVKVFSKTSSNIVLTFTFRLLTETGK